ncbi:putative monocarboxylate transporter [Diplodia seriata]|uniref:Putative monocarboxylate transporter n=1 Tax=Diplodia seriata TaxID=420778 RepID=A0A0G2GD53_9PEZI|nr:putative monocarboxylate transporter [Diplodia seriata]
MSDEHSSVEQGQTKEEQSQDEPQPQQTSQPPDGGLKAWLCVLGCGACYFCSYGWINTLSVFQEYYKNVALSSYSSLDVGWIATLQNFFLQFCGPFVGLLFDRFGPRYLLITGAVLHVFGLMMASISKEYYQFVLSQGVCSSIGTSFIFNPATVSVPMWFSKRRGLAIALSSTGAPIGGVIYPIFVNRLIDSVDFGWAMRRPVNREIARRMLSGPFVFLVAAFFFFTMGVLLPITYMTQNAVAKGLDTGLSRYLVSMYNAGAFVGRVMPGLVGHKTGFFDITAACCVATGVLTLALWIPAAGTQPLVAFAVLFGWAANAVIAAMPMLISLVSAPHELGVRAGTVFGFAGLGALAYD